MNFTLCKLKIHLLPLLIQEIELISNDYLSNLKLLLNNNDEFMCNKHYELQELILNRITEIEDFYELNFGEDNIENFEIARLKLKKLLMYDINNIKSANEIFLNKDKRTNTITNNTIKTVNEIRIDTKSIKPPILKTINSNKLTSKSKDKNKRETIIFSNKEIIKTDTKQNKTHIEEAKVNNSFFKVEEISPTENQTWKEISFKLLLTEKEYKLLMEEKANSISLNS